MAGNIGKGDWVECIKGNDAPDGTSVFAGHVYQVADLCGIIECPDCGAEDGVDLVGQPVTEMAWCFPCHFRPITRRDESLIERLLEPLPADATPDPIAVPVGRAG